MKTLLSLLVFSVALFGQTTTKVTVTQVTTLPPPTVNTVLVFLPGGSSVAAILDSSLVLDTSVNPPVLKTAPTVTQTWFRNEAVAVGATPPATITLAHPLVAG